MFKADQVEGFSIPEMPALPGVQRIQRAEDFFRTGARIVETGMRAYYNSNTEEIHMPPFSNFKKADYFYSTLAHETIHNADSGIMPRRPIICIERTGIGAPYIENWLKVLKSDKRAIFTAAGKAQQAVD